MKTPFHVLLLALLLPWCLLSAAEKPNLVVIYTDDQGYGDVSALNPESKFQTPNLDRLVEEGMTFTDGHSSDTVCTPSRYGLLTGRYSWRTHYKRGVLGSDTEDCLIENERLTIGDLLQDHGYTTAMVGKWHLGMQFVGSTGKDRDWSAPFTDGPIEHGFDYFFGTPASMNFGINAWLEQDRVLTPANLWTAKKPGEVVHDRSSYRIMPPYGNEPKPSPLGAALEVSPDFFDEDALRLFTEKSIEWLDRIHAEENPKPFFLYVPLTSPHKPVCPTPEFEGTSECGAYGDFMVETDHRTGQILDKLDELGVADNTIVLYSSDNGPEKTYIKRVEVYGHDSAGVLRGGKRDLYEGGHRVPFLVRWPAGVKAGSTHDGPVCQTDLLATMADILGADLPEDAGEDSHSFLAALKGAPMEHAPQMHHSASGHFALRDGDWKLIFGPDSQGKPAKNKEVTYQLFNLKDDLAEETNLVESHPEVVQRLTDLATKFVQDGRSTEGPAQPVDPAWWPQLVWIPEP